MPRICLSLLLMGALGACGGEPPAPEPEPPAPDVSAAEALIARSIAYHDPAGLWDRGEIALRIMESRPNGVTRTVEVGMAPGSGAMEVRRETDAAVVSFAVSGEEVLRRARGRQRGTRRGGARRTRPRRRTRDVAPELLPVRLGAPDEAARSGDHRGPGAGDGLIQRPGCAEGPGHLRPEVGGDTWYFYFHPETARLIGYRFYHDESANDGEYIHLEGEIENGGLRLPAKRSWFFHQGEEYLGEDEAVSLTVTP